MSWLYSQALVAEYSAASCLGGEPFVLLNKGNTQQAFCAPDKMTAFSRLSQFGMTFGRLTEDLGAGLLTWFLADSRAKTSAQPVKVMGLTAKEADYGRKWLGLLARYNPDLRLWRTPQSSLVEGWDEFSETWPSWGSMRNGESWERIMPELRTCATEFGLWPTPCATDSSDRKVSARMHQTKRGTYKHIGENGTLSQVRLSQVVKHRTPNGIGRLSADWTEWFLMGWPIGHTDLRPLATDKFQQWLRQHGEYSEDHNV